jgi:hypothetical protein
MGLTFTMQSRLPNYIAPLFKITFGKDALYRLEPIIEDHTITAYRFNIKEPLEVGKQLELPDEETARIRNIQGIRYLSLTNTIMHHAGIPSTGRLSMNCEIEEDYFIIHLAEKIKN